MVGGFRWVFFDGVGNNGGVVKDVDVGGCRELEDAPVVGQNVLRASICFSSCNLA